MPQIMQHYKIRKSSQFTASCLSRTLLRFCIYLPFFIIFFMPLLTWQGLAEALFSSHHFRGYDHFRRVSRDMAPGTLQLMAFLVPDKDSELGTVPEMLPAVQANMSSARSHKISRK